jgi:hypothetical protein
LVHYKRENNNSKGKFYDKVLFIRSAIATSMIDINMCQPLEKTIIGRRYQFLDAGLEK